MYTFTSLYLLRTTALESLQNKKSFLILARLQEFLCLPGSAGRRSRSLTQFQSQRTVTAAKSLIVERNFSCLHTSRLHCHNRCTSFFGCQESTLTCSKRRSLHRRFCARTPSCVNFKHRVSGNHLSSIGSEALLSGFQVPMVHHGRHLASKKNKRLKKKESDNESDSDEEIDLSGFEGTQHHDEDRDLPKNFRTLQVNVKSPRVDSLIAAGLNISRSKTEDYFLGSKLRVNGEKCLKKSKKVEPGDSLDLVMETGDNFMKVKRVRILAVSEERTKSDRCKVLIKAWRSAVPVDLPQKEFHGKQEE